VDAGGVLPCAGIGKRPTPLLMDRSALLQVLRHPVRDRVDAHPVQCVWLSDLWAGPSALYSTPEDDASVCRGVGPGPPL
ncbi:Hypothetical protein DHA2_154028, partial [Giardia duodenalis]